MAERYRQQVIDIVESFTYELCDACGEDIDMHVILPDPLGNAHAWCMVGEEI